jgi:two-component system chemotaxis sensor kinase CheA
VKTPVDFSLENLEEAIAKGEAEGFTAFGVRAKVAESCTFKGVRAFMVYKVMADNGDVLATLPDLQTLQEEKFEQELQLVALSKRTQEMLGRVLKNISEIESVEIVTLSADKAYDFFGEVKGQAKILVEAQPAAGAEQKIKATAHAVQSIRVSIERLDNLQNLVGELVINKIRLTQISKQYNLKELKEALTQFDRITDELQDEVTEVRMVPMEHIFNRFPRMVRDLAKERGKEIELLMEGKEIELDRTVLDEINDPLVHLLRNAVDHGIEVPDLRQQRGKPRQGLIRLIATREKNHVIIKVVDDGKGINPKLNRQVAVERGIMNQEEAEKMTDQEAINLIALPGFTTAKVVTEVSGRGVGVDAVRTKIESFGGGLKIESEVDKGSTFILRMPMTLAIIQALLFRIQNEIYSIPVVNTVETIEFAETDLKHVQHGEVVMYRDSVLPLVRLQRVLEVPLVGENNGKNAVLVTEVGDLRVGLLVDEVLGQQEIAIKSLGQLLKGIKGFSGVTILGDGRISLVLDVPSLI